MASNKTYFFNHDDTTFFTFLKKLPPTEKVYNVIRRKYRVVSYLNIFYVLLIIPVETLTEVSYDVLFL